MNKGRFERSMEAAEVIYDALCIKTNCIDSKNKVVRADYVIAIDDDPTSAFWATWLYYRIYQQHGYHPAILCVGGKGILSKHTHDRSEAELLASVCCKLGVPETDISLAPNGRNTGENIQSVKKILPAGSTIIWSTTKRQSLRLERSVKKQAPELISYYYVVEESLTEAAKIMNGKGIAQNEMMFHELASILERCIKYAGTFQEPIDDIIRVNSQIREADHYLRKHYKLKLMNKTVKIFGKKISVPNKNLTSIFQLFHLLREIKRNKQKMRVSLELEILLMLENLRNQKLIPQDKAEFLLKESKKRLYKKL